MNAAWYASIAAGVADPWIALLFERNAVSAVATIATPRLCDTIRPELNTELARPVISCEIVAKVAACSGITRKPNPMPRTNMSARTTQRFVSRSTHANANPMTEVTTTPNIMSRRGPTRG